jgi:hypothetical protein
LLHTQSLEESINRRAFRAPPNVPLQSTDVNKPAEVQEKHRQQRLIETEEMIREQRGGFLAKMVNDAVVDTTLADFWARNLAAVYADTRVFSYNDDLWHSPLLVPHSPDASRRRLRSA